MADEKEAKPPTGFPGPPGEKRGDPRDPEDSDGEPFGEGPHSPPGAQSTGEPHPKDEP